MSTLGDQTVMTLVAGTAVLGLIGWTIAVLVRRPPECSRGS